nr:unnamed protein product [Digitaria exilis]
MRRPEKLRVLRHLAEIDNRRPPLFFIPKIAHPPALIHVMSRTLHDAGIRHALHDTGVRREAFVTPSTTRSFALAIRVPAPGDAFPVTIRHARAGGGQITTPMAPVAPLPLFASDRDIQSRLAIVDAYKEYPGNPRYAFRHLLFSLTDPSQRVKPVAASDIMWAEAMGKLECMDSADRKRLWPHLVHGCKDLSNGLKVY